jgi:hypothetical protein
MRRRHHPYARGVRQPRNRSTNGRGLPPKMWNLPGIGSSAEAPSTSTYIPPSVANYVPMVVPIGNPLNSKKGGIYQQADTTNAVGYQPESNESRTDRIHQHIEEEANLTQEEVYERAVEAEVEKIDEANFGGVFDKFKPFLIALLDGSPERARVLMDFFSNKDNQQVGRALTNPADLKAFVVMAFNSWNNASTFVKQAKQVLDPSLNYRFTPFDRLSANEKNELVAQELHAPGTIAGKLGEISRDWNKSKAQLGFEDFGRHLSKAVEGLSYGVSFLPGVGSALSAILDTANLGYQVGTSVLDAKEFAKAYHDPGYQQDTDAEDKEQGEGIKKIQMSSKRGKSLAKVHPASPAVPAVVPAPPQARRGQYFTRTHAPPAVRKWLSENGSQRIKRMWLIDEPIQGPLRALLQSLSFGRLYKKGIPLHRAVAIELENGETYRLEKNHVVQIKKWDIAKKYNDEYYEKVNVSSNRTVADMIDGATKHQAASDPHRGDIWHYDPQFNNCQIFADDLVRGVQAPMDEPPKKQPQLATDLLNTIPAPLRQIPHIVTYWTGVADRLLYGTGAQHQIARRQYKRKAKPILSGTRKMRWIKGTDPIIPGKTIVHAL